jgi:hypothetical protein
MVWLFSDVEGPVQGVQGNPSANCWWTGLSETGEYDPDKGCGYVLTDDSGSPAAVKIWVHADDFLIHGDTYEKTAARALKLFFGHTWILACCATPRSSHHRRKSSSIVGSSSTRGPFLAFGFQCVSEKGLWLLSST